MTKELIIEYAYSLSLRLNKRVTFRVGLSLEGANATAFFIFNGIEGGLNIPLSDDISDGPGTEDWNELLNKGFSKYQKYKHLYNKQ